MSEPLSEPESALAPKLAAPQHKPRPLPLFLSMLRSETAAEPARMRRALEGLRSYQEAERPPHQPTMPAVATMLGASLRDYGGTGRPVLFVPSLINPPNVLDLSEEKSLLRWLAGKDHRIFLLDWGWDVMARQDMSVADHVEHILLPFLRKIQEPASLVGYCLGGTMAVAAAALHPVRGLATIAAPWHFARFADESRTRLLQLWSSSRATAEALGVLPMEVLQSAFWSMDPARTVSKFEAFAAMDPESAEARAFVKLEDWANDGPPLPKAAARELFESFFDRDDPGTGRWSIGGTAIDPGQIDGPMLAIVSTNDRIVPGETALEMEERIALAQGHVGMVVGRSAREALWEPLSKWLSKCGRATSR